MKTRSIKLLFSISVLVSVMGLLISSSLLTEPIRCTTQILNRFNTTPYVIEDFGASVHFNYASSYQPTYTSQDKPNYNNPGDSFFVLFGDGKYSWSQNPIHEYKNSGIYKYVYFEHTKVKSNNGPPPAMVNPLTQDHISVCESNPNSTTNEDYFLQERKVAFKESRPAYCGYTFVEIIKFGNIDIPAGSYIDVIFDHNSLDVNNLMPYKNMPYSLMDVASLNQTQSRVRYETNIEIYSEEENPIFIQFLSACQNSSKQKETTEICVEISNQGQIIVPQKCKQLTVQKNNPFDPNWIHPDTDICRSPGDGWIRHTFYTYFYFVDNGSGHTAGVTVDITFNNIQSGNFELLTINDLQNPDYETTIDMGQAHIKYVSKPDFILKGVGNNNMPNLPDIGQVSFDVIFRAPIPGDMLAVEVKSEFEGVEPCTTFTEIPIMSCDVSEDNLFFP